MTTRPTPEERIAELGQRLQHAQEELQLCHMRNAEQQEAIVVLARELTRYQETNAALHQQVSDQSHVIKNLKAEVVRLKEAAGTDPLTGLANRRAFDESFTRILAVLARPDKPAPPREVGERRQPLVPTTSLCIFDIDHFKRVNDTYGHPAGDAVLKQMAALIREHLGHRGSDIIAVLDDAESVARFGGEEFVVVLPRASEEAAYTQVSKFLEVVRRTPFVITDKNGHEQEIQVTVSCGISTIEVEEHLIATVALDRLMVLADRALYSAKNHGRDQVVRHDQLPKEM